MSSPLYTLARFVLIPLCRIYFRLHVVASERIPAHGSAIIVPNHKSFFDSFFLAVATRRPIRFMGKSELFAGPWARFFVRLGGFPVRRGEADQEALETAREILRQGGLVALFPEGTRVRSGDALGPPRRGAGRLALETGAPLIPAAITGSEKLFVGPLVRPVQVQVAFGEPISTAQLKATPEAASELLEAQVWPEVERQFRGLLARKNTIAALMGAVGISGGIVARQRRRRRKKHWWQLR